MIWLLMSPLGFTRVQFLHHFSSQSTLIPNITRSYGFKYYLYVDEAHRFFPLSSRISSFAQLIDISNVMYSKLDLILFSSKSDLPAHFLILFHINFFQLLKQIGVTTPRDFFSYAYLIHQSVVFTIPSRYKSPGYPSPNAKTLRWPSSVSWVDIKLYLWEFPL